jgi:hypothetical protein
MKSRVQKLDRALVIGGSMGGLLAARVLADHYKGSRRIGASPLGAGSTIRTCGLLCRPRFKSIGFMCRRSLKFGRGLELVVMFCAARMTGNILEREVCIDGDRRVYLDLHYRN